MKSRKGEFKNRLGWNYSNMNCAGTREVKGKVPVPNQALCDYRGIDQHITSVGKGF